MIELYTFGDTIKMRKLWAPWRMDYITREKDKNCIFCRAWQEKRDETNYVVFRGKNCLTMLNIFPYNNGHLMIAPYRHLSEIENLRNEEIQELMTTSQLMVKLLKKVMKPNGFNIGINLGRAGGAGIVDHLHLHIVPRWEGDTNYMPVISETKVISQALKQTYRQFKEELSQMGF